MEAGHNKVPEENLVRKTEVEKNSTTEVITVTPDNIQVLYGQGKEEFNSGRYKKALEIFEAILKVSPDNVDIRDWFEKTKEATAKKRREFWWKYWRYSH